MVSARRKLSSQEVDDLIEGAIVLGCGGGGDPQIARKTFREISSQGKTFVLIDSNLLGDDTWACILGYVGGGVDDKDEALIRGIERIWEKPIVTAAQELSRYLQIDFEAYLCSEVGAGNVIATFLVAAIEGKAVIDGDAAGGRAKPELVISLTNLLGLPAHPLVAATHYGDVAILKESLNDLRVEQLCRYLARASGGRLAVARCPTQGKFLRPAIHGKSISLAIEIGGAIRKGDANSIERIVELLKGQRLFEGEIEAVSREFKDGFVWGDIVIKGIRDYESQEYRIWFKNENLLGWKDGVLQISCPDQIIMLNAESCKGIYNWGNQLRKGKKVIVLGVGAHDLWKTPKGLELFGPQHFGFNMSYKPFLDD